MKFTFTEEETKDIIKLHIKANYNYNCNVVNIDTNYSTVREVTAWYDPELESEVEAQKKSQ